MRGQIEGAHPVILFCTIENNVSGGRQRHMAAGANEYVMKPFDGSMVRDTLCGLGVAA